MNERMAQTLSFGVSGVNGFPVKVEVFSANGLPAMEVIGLPDASVRESRERVNAAIISSGRQIPPKRITINLAPADTRKEGPSFDLPIAIGILLANGQIIPDSSINLENTVFFGELSLDGHIQPVHGALSIVISASENGLKDVILPAENAQEVACIEGMRIFPARHLRDVIDHLEGTKLLSQQTQRTYDELIHLKPFRTDLSQVRGQKGARRALEVAAAGGHNMIIL